MGDFLLLRFVPLIHYSIDVGERQPAAFGVSVLQHRGTGEPAEGQPGPTGGHPVQPAGGLHEGRGLRSPLAQALAGPAVQSRGVLRIQRVSPVPRTYIIESMKACTLLEHSSLHRTAALS